MNIALLLAAGSSSRFINQQNKLFYEFEKKPLILYTIQNFQASPLIDLIVIVTKFEYIKEIQKIVKKHHLSKVKHIVLGGKTRQESSYLGLKFLKTIVKDDDFVLIHDAARPFVSLTLIEELLDNAHAHQAVVPYIKQVDSTFVSFDDQTVGSYLNREELYRLQTPQVFIFSLIYQAHFKNQDKGLTDDSQLLFKLGKPIYFIEGEEHNFKITSQNDLELVELILRKEK